MKIVHVVRQFPPSVGGLEQAVLNLAITLRDHYDCEISVVTLDRMFQDPARLLPERERVAGLEVIRIPYRGSRRYPIAPAVLTTVGGADVVHVHAIDFFFDFLAALRPFHGRPMIATTHGGFFHTKDFAAAKRAYFRTITRLSARAYHSICATSEPDAQLFRQVAKSKVVTIENGVDWRKLYGAASSQHRHTLMYFGRLSSNKRIPSLFPVLWELKRWDPRWKLIVAGAEDDVTFPMLQDQAQLHDVVDAVHFFRAPSNAQLTELCAQSSYYISASAHEGFGIAVVEAMSAGLVPVLSRIPAFEKFHAQVESGLLFDPARPAEAAADIMALADQLARSLPAQQDRLRTTAQQYDWIEVAGRYLEQYRRAREQARTGVQARTSRPT